MEYKMDAGRVSQGENLKIINLLRLYIKNDHIHIKTELQVYL